MCEVSDVGFLSDILLIACFFMCDEMCMEANIQRCVLKVCMHQTVQLLCGACIT